MKFTLICLFALAAGLQADQEIDLSSFGTSLYVKPSEETGDKVQNWKAESGLYVDEIGQDMVMPIPKAANGIIDKVGRASYMWPNGIVPYVFSNDYNTTKLKQYVLIAIDSYNMNTCVRFVPRTNQADYVTFEMAHTGCWANVGRIGGKQTVNLQYTGCLNSPGTVIHEMMHSIGFFHEQTRPDRDSYVTINQANIDPTKYKANFAIEKNTTATTYNVPYDYTSVMHYSGTAFSINGKETIVSKPPGIKMGQRVGLTAYDIMSIKIRYCGLAKPAKK